MIVWPIPLKQHQISILILFHAGFWQEFENFPADIVVPAGGTGLDKVSLCNLQHLHLELGSSAKLLNALLEVIPNATSLRLSATADDFNIGEMVSALRSKPLMLTKLDCKFDGFNFRTGDHLRPLLKMCSGGLQVLKLDCRDMSHKTFMALSKCSKLQHLTLSNASVFGNDHLEKLVRNVPDLETLHIYGYNRLTGAGLKCVQDLRKLRSLHIEGNAIPNGALSGLGEISTLRDLSLTVSKTDIGIIQTVARLPVLRSLGLHVPNSGILEDPTGTSTIGSGLLQHIACLNGLRILALNVALGSEDFSVICENFPMLEKLALRDCSKLSDADGMKLRLLKHLKSIRMELCLGFNDLTFERGLGSSALEEIDLSSCNVTDAGLASIAAHHGRLRSLSFFHCAAITDTGVASLVEREPYLRYLGLPLCAGLSSRILSLLEPVCPRLRVLIIGGRFIEADSETAERIGRTTHCVIW